MQGEKLPPVSTAFAQEMGAQVWDRNKNNLLDAGDRIDIPTFHRTAEGPLSPHSFEINSENASEFAWILSSPKGFRLKRFARSFGDVKGFVNYFYAIERGKIVVDEVGLLLMTPDGECTSTSKGLPYPEIRDCDGFERSLFLPDADNRVNFMYEKLLIGRHMQAVAELSRLQSEITWQNVTQGANLDIRPTYHGYEFLFSNDAIETVDLLIGGLKESGDERRIKELSFYRSYLVGRWLAREAAPFTNIIASALSTADAVWMGEKIPFYELEGRARVESDPNSRAALMNLKASIQNDVFNPILRARTDHLMDAVGKYHHSYADYLKELRHAEDLESMISYGKAFFSRTESLFRRMLEAESKRWLNMEPSEMSRSNLLELFSFKGMNRFFPPEIMYPFMKHLLETMGFIDDSKRLINSLTIDDEAHPRKDPRPQALAVSIPDDIRISFWPQKGVAEFEDLLHEVGHALHFSNTRVEEWAFKHLGDSTAAESYANLFGSLMVDPHFLKEYQRFVKEWNAKQPHDDRILELSNSDIGRITRLGALRDFFMLRRYNKAKLVYESARVGVGWEFMGDLGVTACGISQELYADLFGDAYGITMDSWDSARYLIDTDDDFYSADYARAFLIQPQLSAKLRKKFGEGWFASAEAGEWLREEFFSHGNYYTAADLNQRFGLDSLDYGFFERDLRWKLLAAQRLESGKSLPPRP